MSSTRNQTRQNNGTEAPQTAYTGEIRGRLIQVQLEKMLSSEIFSRSERMSRFLRFTVEQVLQGHASNLKEYLIGLEVFDKPETLDPRLDPIVRVEAGRLRSKLREYYETEGRLDPVLITLPARSYVPAFQLRGGSEKPAPELRPAPAKPAPQNSIAVLPFIDMSLGRDQEFFCDGLTEEVILSLSRLGFLQVVSRTSTSQFKGKADDIRHIGEALNVRSVLEGSVRQSEGRLRITAQLIDAGDGFHIWTESFDRKVGEDIFAVQQEISEAISREIRTVLLTSSSVTAPVQ